MGYINLRINRDLFGVRAVKKRLKNLGSVFAEKQRIWLPILLAAVVLAAVALIFFGIQNSARNQARKLDEEAAVKTVEGFLNNMKEDPSVLDFSLLKVRISNEETEWLREREKEVIGDTVIAQRGGDEKEFQLTDDFIDNDMIAIYVHYTITIDHTLSWANDGDTKWYYYLVRENQDSPWLFYDKDSRTQATEKKD